MAVKTSREAGPASLRMHLIDALYALAEGGMDRHHAVIHIEELKQ